MIDPIRSLTNQLTALRLQLWEINTWQDEDKINAKIEELTKERDELLK